MPQAVHGQPVRLIHDDEAGGIGDEPQLRLVLFQHDVQNQGLPHIDLWYDHTTNHITKVNNPSNVPGYDAAGYGGDSRHAYLHDFEGNLRCVDNCTKGSNLFDAFGRRVFHHMAQYNNKVERYEYNEDGQIVA